MVSRKRSSRRLAVLVVAVLVLGTAISFAYLGQTRSSSPSSSTSNSSTTTSATSTARYTLTVMTDRSAYTATQPITVSGTISPAPSFGSNVTVIVEAPGGVVVNASAPVNTSTGGFSYTFSSGGSSYWVVGNYSVTVVWQESPAVNATTTFTYTVPV